MWSNVGLGGRLQRLTDVWSNDGLGGRLQRLMNVWSNDGLGGRLQRLTDVWSNDGLGGRLLPWHKEEFIYVLLIGDHGADFPILFPDDHVCMN